MALSSSKCHWHNYVKTHRLVCVDIKIPQFLKGGIDQWGVGCDNSFFWLELRRRHQIFELRTRLGNKSTCVGSTLIMLARVWMPFLVSTMLIHQREEFNVVKRNTCSYFHHTWKPTFHAMVAKVSWIVSWVIMDLLP